MKKKETPYLFVLILLASIIWLNSCVGTSSSPSVAGFMNPKNELTFGRNTVKYGKLAHKDGYLENSTSRDLMSFYSSDFNHFKWCVDINFTDVKGTLGASNEHFGALVWAGLPNFDKIDFNYGGALVAQHYMVSKETPVRVGIYPFFQKLHIFKHREEPQIEPVELRSIYETGIAAYFSMAVTEKLGISIDIKVSRRAITHERIRQIGATTYYQWK